MAAAGRGRGRSSIHRSAARDRDEEGDQCMQSALGEGDREGNNFCANLEDRDKETEVLGGALLMLDIGADFPLGPSWQKLDGWQRGQVHPGSIWQDAVGARPSSRERTWPLSFLGAG